ncbi:MAG: enterochelin esterase [Nocardioidaceae bacterium]|nr:enterochelin esterase [Nocardioidaceae bacterium]
MNGLALALKGRVSEVAFHSRLLEGNPLGDPADRPLYIYVPPGYDDQPTRRYPVVYVIQGYTGQVKGWFNRVPYKPPFLEAVDAVFADRDIPSCILVLVDAFTRYGGSQFVDSPGTGRYHSYLCDEVVPYVDEHYRTLDDPAHRGIAGKSSGGFGAMITPMLRPDLFGGLASHAGDGLYEQNYLPAFGKAVRLLRDYDADIHRWWDDFCTRPAFSKEGDESLLMVLGISACFSAEEDGTPVLPFDPRSGTVREAVWQRWLAWDPIRMVPDHADALRGLRGIWLDAGTHDEFYLDLAALAFRDALHDAGVTDVAFELFDAGHMGIDYRYPLAIRYLAERLSGS